jgi:hypothetical protein
MILRPMLSYACDMRKTLLFNKNIENILLLIPLIMLHIA